MDGQSGSTSEPAGVVGACMGGGTCERQNRGVGMDALGEELLVVIVKALSESVPHQPEKGPGGSELLPLRTVSLAFRAAVDAAMESSGLRVTSHNARNAAMLVRVLNALQTRLQRWPNLMEMRIVFDWKSDYLQIMLSVLARMCPGLQTLMLEAQPQVMALEEDDQPCLKPLVDLPNLQTLVLTGFKTSSRWSEGLSLLSNLSHLELTDQGSTPMTLEPMPHLKYLYISSNFSTSPPSVNLAHILHSTGLAELALTDVSVDSLPPPPAFTALKELKFVRVTLIPGPPGGIHPLLSGPPLLPHLGALHLKDIRSGLPDSLSLEACTALTTLNLSHLSSVRTISFAPTTTLKLQLLKLKDLPRLEELLPLSKGSCPELTSLTLSALDRLETLPALSAFPNVEGLRLHDLRRVRTTRDLSLLTSLNALEVVRCLRLEIHAATLSTLSNLQVLYLVNVHKTRANQPILELPDLSSFPDLKKLWIDNRNNPPVAFRDVSSLSKLTTLWLTFITNLQELPPELHHLHSLNNLYIRGCLQLRGLNLEGLRSLTRLYLLDLQFETSLPALGHLAMLSHLEVQRWPLLESFGALEGLEALESVSLLNCPLVKEADLRGAQQLRDAKIVDCGALNIVRVGPTVALELKGFPQMLRIVH